MRPGKLRGHHSTGITGSRHLYWALGRYGHGDVAFALLHNTTYPSIGYLFSLGATTFWESWGKRGGSLNHPMQGGFTVWLYQGIAAIYPDPGAPGFKHTILRAPVRGDLTSARATYRSLYGMIVSDWKVDGDVFKWDITIPANTSATVYVPAKEAGSVTESGRDVSDSGNVRFLRMEDVNAVFNIGSGLYRFRSTGGL